MALQYVLNFVANTAAAQAAVSAFSSAIQGLSARMGRPLPNPTAGMAPALNSTRGAVSGLAKELLALASIGAITNFAKDAVDGATKAEGALKGLESVANRTGVGAGQAMKAASELSADGILTLSDSATALKNLFSYGFSTTEAVAAINQFKDSAAFGRQSTLGWAEAIVSATEGIRNENSMLVDNAGVTRNVAKMQEDYAKSINKTTESLSQQERKQAIVNGLTKETAAQSGDAAKALSGLQGETARMNQAWGNAKNSIGEQFTPAVRVLTEVLTWLVEKPLNWVSASLKTIGVVIAANVEKMKAWGDFMTTFDWGALRKRMAEISEQADKTIKGFFDKPTGPAIALDIKDNLDPVAMAKLLAERAKAKEESDAKVAVKSAERKKTVDEAESAARLARVKSDADSEMKALEEQHVRKSISETEFQRRQGAIGQRMLKAQFEESTKSLDSAKAAAAAAKKNNGATDQLDEIAKTEAAVIKAAADVAVARASIRTEAQATRNDVLAASIQAGKDSFEAAMTAKGAELEASRTTYAADAAARVSALEGSLQLQAISYSEYLAKQKALLLAQNTFEGEQLKKSLAIAKEKQGKADDVGARASAAAEITTLNAEIAASTKARGQIEQDSILQTKLHERELVNTREDLKAQAAGFKGDDFGQRMQEIETRYKRLRKDPKNGDAGLLADLANNEALEKATVSLAQTQRRVSEAQQEQTLKESALERDYQQGVLTTVEYEQRLADSRGAAALVLKEQVKELKAQLSERPADTGLQLQIAQLEQGIQRLQDESKTFTGEFNRNLADSIGKQVRNFTSLGDAIKNVFLDILGFLADKFSKSAADQIFAALQKATASDAASNWLSKGLSYVAGALGFGGGGTAAAALPGKSEGGWTGPGAKMDPAGIVHADEFVIKAESQRKLPRPLLEFMNTFGRLPKGGYSEGGLVGSGISANIRQLVMPTASGGGGPTNIAAHMYFDRESAAEAVLNTRNGEARVVDIISRNKRALGLA